MRFIFIFLVFISCALIPEHYDINKVSKSGELTAFSSGQDYTDNLWDDWAGNRGIILNSDDFLNAWKGMARNRQLVQVSQPALPLNGYIELDGLDYFKYLATASDSLTGDFTLAVYARQAVAQTGTRSLFDSNTNVPRLICYTRTSTGFIGIAYNGVVYNTTTVFPSDNVFHTLIYSVSGLGGQASIYLDGSLIGTFSITGGGLNANTGQYIYFMKGTTTTAFSGHIKKMRVYKEALNDSAVSILNTGDFVNDIIDNTPCHVRIIAGQSNCGAPTENNLIDYPIELQGEIQGAYLWNYSNTDKYTWKAIDGSPNYFVGNSSYPIYPGPFLKLAYDLKQANPTDNVYIIEHYKSSTSLAVSWAPTKPLRETLMQRIREGLLQLKCEQRNIASVKFLWIQGENDSTDSTNAANYKDNLILLDSEVRANISTQYVDNVTTIISYLSDHCGHRTSTAFFGNVTYANQLAFVNMDTVLHKGINTDDLIDFPMIGSNVHYSPVGYVSIGREAAKY